MTINQNSLTAKFYRWFYEKENLPKNLCPFFWALALGLLLSPIRIVMGKNKSWPRKIFLGLLSGVIILEVIILGLVFIYLHIELILCLCGCYYYDSKAATIAAYLDLGIACLFLIIVLIASIPERESKSLIVEMVKARYNKYCPQINWK